VDFGDHKTPETSQLLGPDPIRVLVLSTSIGEGHNGNAVELINQLKQRGHQAVMIDQLDLLPFRFGQAFRTLYRLQLRFAPWSYEGSWKRMNRMHRFWAAVNGVLCWRRLFETMCVVEPDLIVANNPLAAQTLGHLSSTGRMDTPIATVVTDFGVHDLWVHKEIDAHLCVHSASTAEVTRLGGQNARTTGPLVRQQFFNPVSKQEARATLGLSSLEGQTSAAPVVLVTSGSWGVGEVENTVKTLIDLCGCRVIVPCGKDVHLQRRLSNDSRVLALGWVNEMETLIAASDVVVENAGGLSAMEAFAARRPVITYRPIPGHGRHNSEVMHAAGVSRLVNDVAELQLAITEVVANSSTVVDSVIRASDIFTSAGPDLLVGLAQSGKIQRAADPALRHFVGKAPRHRKALVSIGVMTGLYTLGTGGVSLAVSAGAKLAPQVKPAEHQAFVAAMVNEKELNNPAVRIALKNAGVAVIVDPVVASENEPALRELVSSGVPIASSTDSTVGSYVRTVRKKLRNEPVPPPSEWFATHCVAEVIVDGVDLLDVAQARRSHIPFANGRLYKSTDPTVFDENPVSALVETEFGSIDTAAFEPGDIYIEDERDTNSDTAVERLVKLQAVIAHQQVEVVALGKVESQVESQAARAG
jgi:processive 1,2-diacylglycerol beta-glucosyltransferase